MGFNVSSRFIRTLYRLAGFLVRVLEIFVIVILVLLTLMASIFLIRDLFSLRPTSTISELQFLFTSLFTIIILIELLRTFITPREEERYIEGFIEAGIIIFIREVAMTALSGNIFNALMASGGALLLILSLMILRRVIYK